MKPYYQDDKATLYHGDCIEALPGIPSVDFVVTDPPYSIGLQSNGKMSGWGDLMNGSMFFAHLLRAFYRLTHVRQGAAWVFCSWRSFPVISRAAYETEWPIESLLVWDKEWIGPGGTKGLRPSYELVALFAQAKFSVLDRSLPDIWSVPCGGGNKPTGHPAEKPVRLMELLIDRSYQGGDAVVLDPFAGSGTTLVAAKNLGHKAIGIEIEERYCEMAANRLAQEKLDLTLERQAV